MEDEHPDSDEYHEEHYDRPEWISDRTGVGWFVPQINHVTRYPAATT